MVTLSFPHLVAPICSCACCVPTLWYSTYACMQRHLSRSQAEFWRSKWSFWTKQYLSHSCWRTWWWNQHTVTSITLQTRVSLKKSNVKPFPITDSLHTDTKSSWEVFLINLSVTVRLVCLFAPGAVMSLSISITSLSHSHSEITRLSAALSACCSVCYFSL